MIVALFDNGKNYNLHKFKYWVTKIQRKITKYSPNLQTARLDVKYSTRFEVCQALRQQCYEDAYQTSERLKNSTHVRYKKTPEVIFPRLWSFVV